MGFMELVKILECSGITLKNDTTSISVSLPASNEDLLNTSLGQPGGKFSITTTEDCVENLSIVFITGTVVVLLLILLVLVLICLLCCLACKVNKLKSALEGGGVGGRDGKKLKGILENPLYNDLPMSNVEARNTTDQDPGYHELQGIETAVSYETVSTHPPTQLLTANYDDVILPNYGEDKYMKSKAKISAVPNPPGSSRAPKEDNYDEIILSNYDDVAGDENLISQSKGKGYGKPAALPPPSETEAQREYSMVTKGAKMVIEEASQAEYNHLVHQHQHSASTSMATKTPECYSKLNTRQHSSSFGQLQNIGQPQDGTRTSAVRKSVDLKKLMESDEAEVLYFNTISANSQGDRENLEVPEDDSSLYINVKH